MKVLITGGKGLVGRNLYEKLEKNFEVIAPGKDRLNVEEKEKVITTIKEINPEIIIHCAAYTDVDGCEINIKKAYITNAIGTYNISLASSEINCFLIYISTDFVFDGKKKNPYSEFDIPSPLSIYGKTKLAGEYYVSHLVRKFLIIRTSKIFGKNGRNFASRFPFLLKEKKEFHLTTDIVNSPTYVEDLVNAIEFLIKNQAYGIVNICNKGECSWFEFGRKLIEITGEKNVKIFPVSFSEFKGKKAPRPPYSALDTTFLETLGFKMPEWEVSLKKFIFSL